MTSMLLRTSAGGLLVPRVSSAQYGLIDILVFITEIYSS
jgi:hypothetical protein